MPFYRWRCPRCEGETDMELCEVGAERMCCGGAMRKIPQLFHHDAWGRPRYIASLDRTYDSHAELKSDLRRKGLRPAPSADKHHGARNESHLGLGRLYSLPGRRENATTPTGDRTA